MKLILLYNHSTKSNHQISKFTFCQSVHQSLPSTVYIKSEKALGVNVQILQSLRHAHVKPLHKLSYFFSLFLWYQEDVKNNGKLMMANKLYLFSPTQHKFILIQIVTFTCVLHFSACT
jgi:hypothetical protein